MRVRIKYMNIYIFLVMWQFFLFDNGRLRLYPYIFWPLMSIVAFLNFGQIANRKVTKLQGFSVLALLICGASSLLSPNRTTALLFLVEVCMYYICVEYICGKEENIAVAINIAHGFTMFHLVFLLLQRFLPSVFNFTASILKGGSEVANVTEAIVGGSQITPYFGLTGQTSTISLYLILGLLISLYKIGATKKKREYLYVAIFLVGLFLTNRRMNSLCGVTLVVCYLALENRSFLKKLSIVAVAVAVVMVVGYRNIPGLAGIIDKFTLTNAYDNILSGRGGAWETAITLFQEHPWMGIGFCGFTNYSEFVNAHNSYLQKLCELGIIGAIVFFMPYFRALYCSVRTMFMQRRNRRTMDEQQYSSTLLTFLFLLYVAAISFTEGMFETQIFFIVLFLFQNAAQMQFTKQVVDRKQEVHFHIRRENRLK